MKAIFVNGDDYSALHFEEQFKGQTVKSIIESGETLFEEDEYYITISVEEVGEVSKEFLSFVRDNLIDHDRGKHENFWLENETV